MKTRSQETLDAYGCPSSFMVPRPQLSDLPTLVPALPHMVTGRYPGPAGNSAVSTGLVLAVHRAVCPWVSCRLHRSHVGCPYNGVSVDPSWTPQVACIRPFHAVHIPHILFSRGPSSNVTEQIPTFGTIKTSSRAFQGPRPLAGPAPLCPPDY